jgi:hypothetical protein
MINGYQRTCVIVAALQIGLFERLGRSSAPASELARELGADERSFERLVRALRVLALVELEGGALKLTSAGRLLLKDGFGAGLRAWALLVGEEYLPAWTNLRHSVKTGEPAFEKVFGTSAWNHRKEHPELNECFNVVTSGVQLRTISALLAAYDFATLGCLVDVGGGHGNLVAGVLIARPNARGIVFDLPHVVEGAPAALDRAGVRDRCEIVGGSFLESVPRRGDVYVLKHILHNWDDASSVTILRNCRAAMGPSAKVLVLENALPEQDVRGADALVMLDVHMMAVLGGRERTVSEYRALFEAAGLRFTRCIETREGAPSILEADVPAAE